MTTDYVLPPHNWTPPMGVTLTPGDGAVVVPGAGGTLWVRTNPNAAQAGTATRLAFFGLKYYNHNPQAFNNAIQICTPITCDGFGNLYFGYLSNGQPLPGYPRRNSERAGACGLDRQQWHVRRRQCSCRRRATSRRSSTTVLRPSLPTDRECMWR